jgi:hypothetical protein
MSFVREAKWSDPQLKSGPPMWKEYADPKVSGQHTSEPFSLNWKQIVMNEILDVRVTRTQDGWDGYDAVPISQEAAIRALTLIDLAPDSLPHPEIAPSADGEIAFEWRIGCERIMTVIAYPEEIIFSATLSPADRENGRKPHGRSWPPRVLEILSDYFLHATPATLSNR